LNSVRILSTFSEGRLPVPVVISAVLGALVLIWGGVFALIRWVKPLSQKHLLGFAGYASVVSGLSVLLVVQTALQQQDVAMKDTRERLDRTVDTFREKLDEQGAKLLDRTLEKVDLTRSEWEVRADLQEERSRHARTNADLRDTRTRLQGTEAALTDEVNARNAFSDSLNTERALRRNSEAQLDREGARHKATLGELARAREKLAASEARAERQREELAMLRTSLQRAEQRVRDALRNASMAQNDLIETMIRQVRAAETLQAAVDSIYGKVMKRPRNP
jgi:chromosome segregation ATPase